MSRTTIYVVTGIFLLIVAGMFGMSYLNSDIDPSNQTGAGADTEPVDTDANTPTERITAKHFFIDGTHTLVGEIDMPTPCDLLEYDTVVQESMPEQVRVDFTVINNADTCAQVITPQRFMVTVDASKDAVFTATLRGESVTLNLVPAADGETPDEFELYSKG